MRCGTSVAFPGKGKKGSKGAMPRKVLQGSGVLGVTGCVPPTRKSQAQEREGRTGFGQQVERTEVMGRTQRRGSRDPF